MIAYFILMALLLHCFNLALPQQGLYILAALLGLAGLLFKRLSSARYLFALLTTAAFSVYMALYTAIPGFAWLLERVSVGVSGLGGALVGKEAAFGPSYSGLHIVVFALIGLLVGIRLFLKPAYWKKMLAAVAGLFLVWLIYIAIWTFLAENSLALGLHYFEPITGPLNYRLLLFAFVAAPLYLLTRKDRPVALPKALSIGAAGVGVLALALLPLLFLSPQKPYDNKAVLFYDSGIDFSLPEYGRYNLNNVGMFGALGEYLAAGGYASKTVREISAEDLDSHGILVIYNLMTYFSPQEKQDIWDFVERGGSLLCVGDHTGDEQIRLPFDDLLEPVGIRFAFDSAIPFYTLWNNSLYLAPHVTNLGIGPEQTQVNVGASLELPMSARPLITGVYGYSDAGDFGNAEEGMLGDMQFNRGERVGDLALVAEAFYGKGRVIVFGDTTTFQNTVLGYTADYVDGLFGYLANQDIEKQVAAPREAWPKAAIDLSHAPHFSRDKSDDCVDGYIANLLRAEYLPRLEKDFSALADYALVTIIAPTKAYSEAEIEALRAYMAQGGRVILSVAEDSPEAGKKLLEAFGYGTRAVPLGQVSPEEFPEASFWNAYPLLPPGEARVLCSAYDYALLTEQAIGAGSLVVIGDGNFLLNKNIETAEDFSEPNIDFLRELLKGAL